ncbi:hypothetical protein Tco_0025413 [Tanacetum coccineum]
MSNGCVREICPDIHKPSEKLDSVKPINKKKIDRSKPVVPRRMIGSYRFPVVPRKRIKWNPTLGYSMFDARHELCFLKFISDMNARRNFTLAGNACPLTRITATNKVPLREPIPLKVVAQESVVTKVYTRRPKMLKTNRSNSKPKIEKSMISNKTELGTSRGSNTSVTPSSSSSVDLRLSKLSCDIWTPDAPST